MDDFLVLVLCVLIFALIVGSRISDDGSRSWNCEVCVLQVTNTSERTVELRALMDAADASPAWDLRCEVRERLVDLIRREYPHALPRLRPELEKGECQ